jgi:hypothetical protein
MFGKKPLRLLLIFLLSWNGATAGYTSIYVFGDGVCTTTQPDLDQDLYNGGRLCNGPVWIEKLSEFRGITYDQDKNNSFLGHHSAVLVDETDALVLPGDAATSIFIVWSSNADFVKFVVQDDLPTDGSLETKTLWDNAINQALANQVSAVTTLYQDKGARTVVLMHAVDLMSVPLFNETDPSFDKNYVTQRVIQFNNKLAMDMDALEANPSLSGLNIIRPNVFSFTEGVIANPAAKGLVNPFPDNAAILALFPNHFAQGQDYIFWDDLHPTAKFQNELALFVNALIPPLDNVPPVLTIPGDIVKAVPGSSGTAVTFTTSAVDAVDGPVSATAIPASGSTFPVGTTTVNVSASDAAGNVANGSFKVTVVNLNGLLNNVVITPAGAGSPAISGLIQGGPPSGNVMLQASTDLGISDPWRDLSTIILDASGNQAFGPVQDPQGAGLKRDFFRIKLPLSP